MISVKQSKFIGLAIDQAIKSNMSLRHGCVITSNGKIASMGYNHYRSTHRGICIPSTHAEHDTINRLLSQSKVSL